MEKQKMPPKNVPILAIPFLLAYLLLRAMVLSTIYSLACLICAPYAIINGVQPKWMDKLDEYIGIYNP